MKPTPQIETEGLRAYEQARAYERLRSWRLPLCYAALPLAPAVAAVLLWKIGHEAMAFANVCAVVLFTVIGWCSWKVLTARYATNLRLLAELEKTYGDQLPWVQVEKHFAALDKLRQELAEEESG